MIVKVQGNTGKMGPDKMKVGQVGYVEGFGSKDPHLVLRCYRGLVSLNDPTTTWTAPFGSILVDVLPAGTVIELTTTD